MRILGGFFEINVFLLLSSRDAAGVALCACCQVTALDIAEQRGLVDQAPAPSPYLLEDLAPYSGGSIKKKQTTANNLMPAPDVAFTNILTCESGPKEPNRTISMRWQRSLLLWN